MELQTNDDPVWTYFDSQHAYIMKQMNTSFKSCVSNIKGTTSVTLSDIGTEHS